MSNIIGIVLQLRDYLKKEADRIYSTEHKRKIRQTIIGRLKCTYYDMCKRTRNNGWKKIISRKEFIKFGLNSKEFRLIFKRWIDSKCLLKLCPSIDRVDNSKGYVKGNLQFLTLSENSRKAHNEDGFSKNRATKILVEKDGKELVFESVLAFSKHIKQPRDTIHRAIKKQYRLKSGWFITRLQKERKKCQT